MMFSRLNIAVFYAVFASSFLAAAKPWNTEPTTTPVGATTTVTVTSPGPTTTAIPASDCSTAPIECCSSVVPASDPNAVATLGLLGIVLSGLDVLVGLGCTPISVVGAGSGSCGASPVCCEDNSHGGLVSIGCVPVSL